MGIVLYEHNQKAYDAALSLMDETGKAAVIHPTGTGKSFIGFKLAEQHPDSKIFWLSPSEYIYKTQIENLKSVSDGYEPDNITFMTYAKLMMTDETEIEEIQPDYIILDEFHRCGAVEWGKGVERLLNTYPDVPLCGFTATKVRYLDGFRDTADELFENNIASEMTLGDAVVQGILPAPTYVISVYAYEREFEKYTARVSNIRNNAARKKGYEYLEALRRTLEKADGLDIVFKKHIKDKAGKFIVFCSNIEHMNELLDKVCEWFREVDEHPHVYKTYSSYSTASEEFRDFKADNSEHLKLLYCIDMLNEGVHVENISGVILSRPTVSPIVYKQQIGRALSANKSKGKSPIIFDIVNNFENLQSIGSLQDEMEQAVYYYQYEGESERIVNETFQIIDETLDCRELFGKIQESLSASWDEYFIAAKAYFEEYGDLRIPYYFTTSEGLSLGSWIIEQRRIRTGKKTVKMLNEYRIELLDSIGMVWENFSEERWEVGFSHAKKYYEIYGNLDVMYNYIDEEGYNLGNWLARIRKVRLEQSAVLTEQRICELDKLGMIWNKRDYLWAKSYKAAETYFKKHGNLNVPFDYVADEINLGYWINYQRMLKKGRSKNKSVLSEEQIAKLDALKMDWIDRDLKWEVMYSEAKNHYERFGTLDVPAAFKTDNGIKLGSWLYMQRNVKKMDESKRDRLNAIGMLWGKEDVWESFYTLAKAFYERNGHLNIPHRHTEDGKLIGKWIYDQRRLYRSGNKSLTPEKIKRLENIGIEWLTVNERSWETKYNELRQYFEENGNLRLLYKENRLCNSWVKNQRVLYKKGLLTNEQITKLQSLGIALENKPLIQEAMLKSKEVPNQHTNRNATRI